MQGKIIIQGKIAACTGLRIGGSPAGLNIGGVDNPVIKDHEGKPYIPGSSLKGKMRSLLEKSEGLVTSSSLLVIREGDIEERISIHMCNEKECSVCTIFGRTNLKKKKLLNGSEISITNTTVSRLIVRDAYLDEDSIPERVRDNLDLEWTEVKFENSIDRITSAANLRQTERVPRGAKFNFEVIYTIYTSKDREDFIKVIKAMRLLEDDYLGGAGSRGYGQVKFEGLKVFWNSVEDYETGNVNLATKEPWLESNSLSELMELLFAKGGLSSL
ncbi:MAG: type III-A CRISPR-associated RAMP protein Csm3 [Thermoanaerobacteraceae bacterium]|nr:type III-A CRISPR-associated RAMP protein Csm3 [Thermoanaerobacteraceae bacterium]